MPPVLRVLPEPTNGRPRLIYGELTWLYASFKVQSLYETLSSVGWKGWPEVGTMCNTNNGGMALLEQPETNIGLVGRGGHVY